MITQEFKHLIRNNPTLFRLLWKRHETRLFKRRVIRDNDDLVIEGFPRSGNTFATYALQSAHHKDLNIGNHFHSPAQFFLAKKYNIPSLLLIRKPVDAVISLTIYHQHDDPYKSLLAYIRFHEPLIKILPSLVIATFEEAITDINLIIKRLNHIHRMQFCEVIHNDEYTDKIIMKIEHDRTKRLIKNNQDRHASELRMTTPSDKKDRRKRYLLTLIQEQKYQSMLDQANKLYDTLMKHCLNQ